jgi:hypothetical protein
MSAWFTDGTIFLAILALTVVEAVVLIMWHRATGRGLAPLDAVFQLAAGAFLLLAAALAAQGAYFGLIGAALAAAGISHVLDLIRRLDK